MVLDELDFEILALLYKQKEPLASEQIGTWINRSSRTVRNRIKVVNENVRRYGARIDMLPGVGVQLKIDHQLKFARLMERVEKGTGTADTDLRECIILFISQRNYLTAEDLCEQLFISRSKLTTLLKELRRILNQYRLRLASKAHYGMRIEGSELNFRRFIASYYVQDGILENGNHSHDPISVEERDRVYHDILMIVQEQLKLVNYTMPIAIQKNLVNHLVIMLRRSSAGRSIELSPSVAITEVNGREVQLATCIIRQIEKVYLISVLPGEIDYIAMHLVGKKVLTTNDTKRISPEINQLVADILQKIYDNKKIDLLQDFDLRMMLALHLVPLLSRIRYGIELKNPILDEVKVESVAGYDLAIICGQMINENYHTILSDHELSYFAIHFDVALHKKQEQIDKKDVLIICASGRASAQLLKIKFEQLFTKYLSSISVCDVSDIPDNPNEDYDYIFTTIKLPEDVRLSVPVFEFSFFLDDLSIKKIESVLMKKNEVLQYFSKELFVDCLDLPNRQRILDEMIRTIEKVKKVPKEFGELVWERERFLGTDLVTNIAFPHPSRVVTDETFIAVALLKEGIIWEQRRVKIVILVSISKDDSELYKPLLEKIVGVMTSPERVNNILRQRTFESLTRELENI